MYIHIYIYIFTYIHTYTCCEVIFLVQVWGFWELLSGPSRGFRELLSGPSLFLAYKKSGFKRFVRTQLSFCVFCGQLSGNFLKKGAKIGLFNFQCFKFKFWKLSFFRFAKTLKNRGFSDCLCFVLLKRKKTGKKMITGISEFCFFCSKNGRFVTHLI